MSLVKIERLNPAPRSCASVTPPGGYVYPRIHRPAYAAV